MTSNAVHWLPVEEASQRQRQQTSPVRIAILSTPRTGNTWLRYLFTTLYGATGLAVHHPDDLDWEALPADCILQIHWHPVPSFLTRLETYRFQRVVLVRHPLDVLISILQFSLHDPTHCWLHGLAGNEQSIHGAMPCSAAFLNYATGSRAAALLSVSPAWCQQSGTLKVRYEDLVQDTTGELQRLTTALGKEPKMSLVDVVASATLPKMRTLTKNHHHFWVGKFGLWKSLLPAAQARRIFAAHQELFEQLGYSCDPRLTLETGQADANWIQLVWPDLAESLQNLKCTRYTLNEVQWQLQGTQAELEAFRQAWAAKQDEVASTYQLFYTSQAELASTRHTLKENQWQLQGTQAELEAWRKAYAAKQDEVASTYQLFYTSQAELQATNNTFNEIRWQLQGTQAELEAFRQALAAKQDEVASTYQLFYASQAELQATQEQLTSVRQAFGEKKIELQASRLELELAHQSHQTLTAEINHLHQRLTRVAGLGPLSLWIARSLGQCSRSFPVLSTLAKRLLRAVRSPSCE